MTAFLVLMLIVNPLVALQYLVGGAMIKQSLPSFPTALLPVLALLTFANLAFAIAIWKWKRWGLYGFIASSAIAFLINLTTIGVGTALLGLLGVVLLAVLVRPVWSQME